ncbi:MAG: hypothetical protein KAT47_00375 [Candidatus Aegiribacteria sp.]|nr:hypothetical protein [Candidatus Aegiribacteria sp.]
MTKIQCAKRIVLCESIGFLTVIIFLWLDEIFDLPHLFFGASATPVNYRESIFETFMILLLAYMIIFLTLKLLKRIKVLEGILPICSFCRKIRINGEWIIFDSYIRDHSEADFSHSVCPSCKEIHYGYLLDSDDSGKKDNHCLADGSVP